MSEPTRNISLRVCLTYAAFGLFWILATDWLAIWFARHVHHVIIFEIAKGALFIGLSAGLLYWYVQRQFKHQNDITAAVAAGQHQQEAALRESELRHRLLGEIITSFAFAYRVGPDRKLELEWATRPIEEVIGYSEAELKGAVSFRSLIHPEDRARQQAALDRVLAGHSEIMEFRLRTKAGQLRWLECYNRPEWSEAEQRVVRIHGASQDITARKRGEAALRDSEERYRRIVETAEEGIWVIDADNRTSFVNPKMARMLGSTVAEMLGRSMFEFMDEEGRAISSANVERRRQGIREQHEFKFLRADGTPLWALLATNPIHGEAGRYLGALAMVSDVTDRRQAEENRQLSVSLLRATLESTADGLLVVDRAGKIVHFNHRFAQLWRIPETILAARDDQQALAFVADQLLHPEEFSAKVAQLYDTPAADSFDMVRFKDGRVFERYSRAQWLDTRPVGRVWSFRDVTEAKRAEAALREAGARLHLLSQRLIEIQESERRHLARELHDEIGQALTATKLNLEVLAREPEPARTKRIADSIAFVERLLHNVRNLSLNLRPPMLDDLGLVAAVRWLLDQYVRTTGGQVKFDHDLANERFAPTIETTCFRVAQEALTNVTRHSRAHHVYVGLHRQNDGLTLSVRDDGRGFDVTEARRRAAHGNSLGLVGMEERVTLAGGRFNLVSSDDTGTELTAWFPLVTAVPIPTDELT